MSTNQSKFVFPAIIMAMVVTALALLLVIENSARPAIGATVTGQDYMSTTTVSGVASGTVPFIVKAGSGAFGTLTIVQPTITGNVAIFDHPYATRTMPVGGSRGSVGAAVSSSTLIVTIPAGMATGTFPFDIDMKTGIVVDVPPGFTGQYVITYR